MGEFDLNNFDDVSNYINFPNDSEDEEDAMTSSPTTAAEPMEQDVKGKGVSLLSPPASAREEDDIEQDDEEDDLYGSSNDNNATWNVAQDSSTSATLDSPVNPQWLSSDPVRLNIPSTSDPQHHPSPPSSDDAKTPADRRTALETIQERNEQLVKTTATVKTSKSFALLPELLTLKQAEDEDEKILASDEGKRLNPKERRQLRNKVSARNFRVRRKEYIGHLESLVESQAQEIEQLRQSLNAVQLENTQLRQESGFLRSIALNQQQPQASPAPNDPSMAVSHPNKDVNPNTFEWPLAYDGSSSPTQPNNTKFSDRNMFGGHNIHAYGVRVPEVHFDKPHLSNASNSLAPPLPPQPSPQYPPNSSRSAQDASKAPATQPPPFPPGAENLGYPGMLQAVSYLYDYIVKASNNPAMQATPPPQQTVGGYPTQYTPYQPLPQQWGDAKAMGAPTLGFNPYMNNGSWGWHGGPPGPAV